MTFVIQQKATDHPDYQKHQVFEDLAYYREFYSSLSFSIPNSPAGGTGMIVHPDVLVYSSIEGTLESIAEVLRNGRIGDAYALLRKFYDSVFINIYTSLKTVESEEKGQITVQEIADWVNDAAQLPEFRIISRHIRESERLLPLSQLFFSDNRYKDLRDRCHDSLHYNFYKNVLINDNEAYLQRLGWLDTLQSDARDLFVLHLSCIFFVNPHYMMSSDYMDALEVGIQPQQGAQYWVAPFIQAALAGVVKQHRSDVFSVLKLNSCMEIE